MAQQIAAIRRDLDIQNRIRLEKIAHRRAHLCIRRQDQEAGCIFAEAQLDRAAKHSFRLDPAQFAFSNLRSVRHLRPWKREKNFVAGFVIRCPANDLALRSAPIVYFANAEPIGVRMARGRGDLRNDHGLDIRAARLDVFGFNARASQ